MGTSSKIAACTCILLAVALSGCGGSSKSKAQSICEKHWVNGVGEHAGTLTLAMMAAARKPDSDDVQVVPNAVGGLMSIRYLRWGNTSIGFDTKDGKALIAVCDLKKEEHRR
jgi:hypothetical protein